MSETTTEQHGRAWRYNTGTDRYEWADALLVKVLPSPPGWTEGSERYHVRFADGTELLAFADGVDAMPDHAPRGIAARESTGIYPYKAIWERRTSGPLVMPMSAPGMRCSHRRADVTVIGTVTYEPGMVRVQLADGSVVRAMVADIRPARVTPVMPDA